MYRFYFISQFTSRTVARSLFGKTDNYGNIVYLLFRVKKSVLRSGSITVEFFAVQSNIERRKQAVIFNHRHNHTILYGYVAAVYYFNLEFYRILRQNVTERNGMGSFVKRSVAAEESTVYRFAVFVYVRLLNTVDGSRNFDVTRSNGDIYAAARTEQCERRARNKTCAHYYGEYSRNNYASFCIFHYLFSFFLLRAQCPLQKNQNILFVFSGFPLGECVIFVIANPLRVKQSRRLEYERPYKSLRLLLRGNYVITLLRPYTKRRRLLWFR